MLAIYTATACMPFRDVLAHVDRFPSITELHVMAALEGEECHQLRCWPPTVQLPPLTALTVGSSCPVSAVTMANVLVPALSPGLSSLAVSLNGDDDLFADINCTPGKLACAWDRFLCVVACEEMKGLRSLELECLWGVSLELKAGFVQGLADFLIQLTQLTHLRLESRTQKVMTMVDHLQLDGAVIGIAIAALKP